MSAKRTFPNRATHTFLKDMTFKPFGGPAGFENGARGQVVNQSSDCGCLEVANPGSRFEKVFAYDDNGNITGISWTNIPSYNQTYAYDEVNRLTSAATYRGAFQYTYDKVGNRLTASQEGTPESYAYVPATNRLATVSAPDPVSITQDAAGNTTGIGAASLVYNQRQRMIRVEEGEETLGEYTYNALGQRVTKTVDGVNTVFHYDFDGNLIAESDTEGVGYYGTLFTKGTNAAIH